MNICAVAVTAVLCARGAFAVDVYKHYWKGNEIVRYKDTNTGSERQGRVLPIHECQRPVNYCPDCGSQYKVSPNRGMGRFSNVFHVCKRGRSCCLVEDSSSHPDYPGKIVPVQIEKITRMATSSGSSSQLLLRNGELDDGSIRMQRVHDPLEKKPVRRWVLSGLSRIMKVLQWNKNRTTHMVAAVAKEQGNKVLRTAKRVAKKATGTYKLTDGAKRAVIENGPDPALQSYAHIVAELDNAKDRKDADGIATAERHLANWKKENDWQNLCVPNTVIGDDDEDVTKICS